MDKKIFRIPVGELEENCYVVADEDSKKCLIIDPGADFNAINEIVDGEKLNPLAVLLTHGHFDHVGAVDDFLKSGICAYISDEDKKLLSLPADNLSAYFDDAPVPSSEDVKTIKEGVYNFGPFEVKVISTPGHTKGSLCYIIGDSIFTGDTLFYRGHGRYDLPTGNYEELVESLKKLKKLCDMKVYSGHGFFTNIDDEKKIGVLKDIK